MNEGALERRQVSAPAVPFPSVTSRSHAAQRGRTADLAVHSVRPEMGASPPSSLKVLSGSCLRLVPKVTSFLDTDFPAEITHREDTHRPDAADKLPSAIRVCAAGAHAATRGSVLQREPGRSRCEPGIFRALRVAVA